ncbi:MAG: PTS sugar transporter subunit IIA [Chromatiales bacterium]
MSVGLLLIGHAGIGAALLESVRAVLGSCPLRSEALSASRDCDPDALLQDARALVGALDSGEGVLVLTDLFGSTPSNIAARLLGPARVRVVTGMNLPMLIRLLNYPQLDLDALTDKALSGGRDGVFAVDGHAKPI